MTADVLLEKRGPIAEITINRPRRLNAMNSDAHFQFSEILDQSAQENDVRVIILSGAGDNFSVGRDLKELAISDPAEQEKIAKRWAGTTRLTDRFDYPVPIIARVRGYALGGGMEIAMACDLIIASETAKFGLPEVKRGLIPFAGGVHRLPRQIPHRAAMGYLITGRTMTAQRAYDLGLVNDVVPDADLEAETEKWAEDIVAAAPLSIASVRECVRDGLGFPLKYAMTRQYPAEELRKASRDAQEGPRAFAEKRTPNWTGN